MASEATLKMVLLGVDKGASRMLKGVGKDADDSRAKFAKMGVAAGKVLAGGLVTAGAAMVKFGQQASALAETQNKVAQIFGKDSADALDKFAESAARNLGQSKQEALNAVATFGIFGKSAGKSGQALVDFSSQMVTLASDMASFNDSTPQEAIEAIGAALRGESEPIRKYGVLLDDATLRQQALKLGLIKTTKEALTPQNKALAAQAEILAQTKDQQGDFARTSGGLANQQRKLKAEFTNLTTELGQKSLPIMLKLTKAAVGLVEGFEDGTGAGGEIRDVLEDLADAGKAVAAFFDAIPGPVKKYGAELLIASVAIGKMNSGLGVMSKGLTGFTTSIKSAETRSAKFKTTMQGVGRGLTNVAGAGGMILLADSADKAGTSMGALEAAAGGALTGAALGAFGGPVGAGIGAGIGALAGATLNLASATDDAGKAAKVSLPTWKQYEQTLEGVDAATTEATRAMAYQRLEQSGLLKATRELGLTDRQAVNAMLGNKAAREKLATALRNQNGLTDEQRRALEKETGAIGLSRLAQLKKNVAIADNATELHNARIALRKFMKEPANKRIGIRGVEVAKNQLTDLRKLIQSITSASGGVNVHVSGGLDTLLNPERRAGGGPVTAGTPYIVGERRAELFVPSSNGRILPSVPGGGGVSIHFNGIVGDPRAAARMIVGVLKDAGVTTGAVVTS